MAEVFIFLLIILVAPEICVPAFSFPKEKFEKTPQVVETGVDEETLTKLVQGLLKQQLYISQLKHEHNVSNESLAAVARLNHPLIGDIQLSYPEYKAIKADLDKLQEFLEKKGVARGRVTSPDFDKAPALKWTKMPIPYYIKNVPSSNLRQIIDRAVQEVQTKSSNCLTFQKINGRPDESHIVFTEDPSLEGRSCANSPLGRRMQENKINISPTCEEQGAIVHEILHSLGFMHTQSRPDRDEFLHINWENIIPGYEGNFEKWPLALDKQNVPYDYNSTMQYYSTAFAKDPRKDTMTPTRNAEQVRKSMGHIRKLSDIDVEELKNIYCASEKTGAKNGTGASGDDQSCTDGIKNCHEIKDVVCHIPPGTYYHPYAVGACIRTCNLCDKYSLVGGYRCGNFHGSCTQLKGDCRAPASISSMARAKLLCPKLCGDCD